MRFTYRVFVMNIKRKIVNIDIDKCNGCGECVKACAEGAIELVNGIACLVAERYCDGLAACLGECPQDAITMVEREAEAFDPEAVEKHLASAGNNKFQIPDSKLNSETMPNCGCPSTQLQMFKEPSGRDDNPAINVRSKSTLSHWPVQIRLIPPTAPFLRNADLLVVSDCVPVAYPNFHGDFIKDRVVMMGCPKFDDTEEYTKKFAQIFKTAGIRSIAVAVMEVSCCSRMPIIVRKGMELAGVTIPAEVAIVNARGSIVDRRPLI